jgi:hypothetical protein
MNHEEHKEHKEQKARQPYQFLVFFVLFVLLTPESLRFPRGLLGSFGDQFSRVGVAGDQERGKRRPRFLTDLVTVSLRYFLQ